MSAQPPGGRRPPDSATGGSRPARVRVLVAHDGGPRAGHVVAIPVDELTGLLVYDGPRWIAVYQRSAPLRLVRTDLGRAEVWTVRR